MESTSFMATENTLSLSQQKKTELGLRETGRENNSPFYLVQHFTQGSEVLSQTS